LSRFGLGLITGANGITRTALCLTLDATNYARLPRLAERATLKADPLIDARVRDVGTIMLDMFQRPARGAITMPRMQDPIKDAGWFDSHGATVVQVSAEDAKCLWVPRRGAAARHFFSDEPRAHRR